MPVGTIGTGTTGAWTGASVIKTYYDKKLLKYTEPMLVHSQFGKKATVPKGMRSVEWRFYDYINMTDGGPYGNFAGAGGGALGLTTGQVPENLYTASPSGVKLVEGVTPADSLVPTVATKTATPDQFGAYIVGTDLVDATAIDPIIDEFTEKLGKHAGLSLDRVCRNVLAAGTGNLQIAGATGTANTDVDAGDVINYDELVEAIRFLKVRNVAPCKNGKYCAVIHTYTWATLMKDADFKDAVVYGQKNNLFDGTLGTFLGVDFYESSEAKVFVGAGGGGIDVYQTLLFGEEAFGTVDLSALKLESIFKNVGETGTGDYLNQRWSLAWKASHATIRLNESYYVQLRHAVI